LNWDYSDKSREGTSTREAAVVSEVFLKKTLTLKIMHWLKRGVLMLF
tara:strand:+ start:1136 stop:1276 length:141 start_codon:yes stop_codon:yes gene_type:complete